MSGPLIDTLTQCTPRRRPIWLMRQAGRYLPEYRELRVRAGSFLELCYNPPLACEVTLQPLRRFDLDAAIVFSDILVVPHAMGLGLSFVENEGPKLQTVASILDVAALLPVDESWQAKRVCETLAMVRKALPPECTLIGFCGAPWTVASYMIEGGSSDRAKARKIAVDPPAWFIQLIEKLVAASVNFLLQQIAAGAEVVQIFDSWAGELPPDQIQRWVSAPIAEIVAGVRSRHPSFPVIVFARGVGLRHSEVASETDATAISVEQGVDIGEVYKGLERHVAVQGNLDPQVLLSPGEELERSVLDILKAVPMKRHIMNLGHGILQQTDPIAVSRLIATVRRYDESQA